MTSNKMEVPGNWSADLSTRFQPNACIQRIVFCENSFIKRYANPWWLIQWWKHPESTWNILRINNPKLCISCLVKFSVVVWSNSFIIPIPKGLEISVQRYTNISFWWLFLKNWATTFSIRHLVNWIQRWFVDNVSNIEAIY